MKKAYNIIMMPLVNYVHNVEDVLIKKVADNVLCHGVQNGSPRHLYVLSNDLILPGDWYWHRYPGGIYLEDDEGELGNAFTEFQQQSSGLVICKKIIASTNPNVTPNALLPDYFIEKYIDEYNAGKTIVEVILDVENDKIKTDEQGFVIIEYSKEDEPKYTLSDMRKAFETGKKERFDETAFSNLMNTII